MKFKILGLNFENFAKIPKFSKFFMKNFGFKKFKIFMTNFENFEILNPKFYLKILKILKYVYIYIYIYIYIHRMETVLKQYGNSIETVLKQY